MNRPRPLPRIAALAAAALCLAAGTALAQPAQPAPAAPPPPAMPPNLEPIPEAGGDAELEPQVTITRRETETIEEARVNGKLMWIKVTPRHGRPYFLVPDGTDFGFIRRDAFDTGLKVPLWVLFTF